MNALVLSLTELVVETATNLPADVRLAVNNARRREVADSLSGRALAIIDENVDLACDSRIPICQDTGLPTLYVHCPRGYDQAEFLRSAAEAVAAATHAGKLRPNSVDSITGRNSGTNLGPGTPAVYFEQWDRDDVEVLLLLKGGGCENKNIQYSLPCELDGIGTADRSIDGVHRCLLHAVHQAQGHGCSVGFLGVCVGGDRATGYGHAKKQLLRDLSDHNPDQGLADLEDRVVAEANRLGIGTMGFGGSMTLLGCKIGTLNRVPASFFVSVAYNCWAFRRLGVVLSASSGEISAWLFRHKSQRDPGARTSTPTGTTAIGLSSPLTEEAVRSLRVGDLVTLSGPVHTGRDALHKHLVTGDSPVDLRGAVIYHCGPVMMKDGEEWKVVAAGPTTSIREEPYEADVLRRFGVRAIIGKGGMGALTLAALHEHGAVYLNAVGGAAAYYAERITRVDGVDFLDEFGAPEAMWHLTLAEFSAVVTMDSHGNSLHSEIEARSLERLTDIAGGL